MKTVCRSLNLTKPSWVSVGLVSLVTTSVAMGMAVCFPTAAVAQPAYGSYIGGGAAFGITNGGPGEDSGVGGVISARYKFLELPISVRGQLFILQGSTAFVPTVSYDIPIGWQADAYVGVGGSFTDGTTPSPVGNRSAFVVQPGIDYVLPNSNLVLYANGVFAFNAFKGNGGTAISIQSGVGLRF